MAGDEAVGEFRRKAVLRAAPDEVVWPQSGEGKKRGADRVENKERAASLETDTGDKEDVGTVLKHCVAHRGLSQPALRPVSD